MNPEYWVSPDLWVLTCAPASRIDEAARLIERLGAPTVVVTTQPDPIPADFFSDDVTVLLFDSTEINISKWWTLGLDWIASHYEEGEKYDVLIVETDADIKPEHVERMRRLMREQEVVMAGADFFRVMPDMPFYVRRDNAPWRAEGRCIGFAQVIAGEVGLRHDPEFRWWLADDDLEWQARNNGGTILVGGMDVHHVGTQGPLTGDRLRAWEEDQEKFRAKWGMLPHDNVIS